MPFGLSAWTIVCVLIFLYGLFIGKYEWSAIAILLYGFGWLLRFIFGTRSQ